MSHIDSDYSSREARMKQGVSDLKNQVADQAERSEERRGAEGLVGGVRRLFLGQAGAMAARRSLPSCHRGQDILSFEGS